MKEKLVSYKWKVLRVLLSITIIPIIIISIIVIGLTGSILKDSAYKTNNHIATGLSNNVSITMANVEISMDSLIKNPVVAGFKELEMAALIGGAVSSNPAISNIVIWKDFPDGSMREVFRDNGSSGSSSELEEIDRAFQGEDIITGIIEYSKGDNPGIVMLKPIYKMSYLGILSKKIGGVMGVVVNPEFFTSIVNEIDAGEGSHIYIVDSEGKLITQSNTENQEYMKDLSELTPVKNIMQGQSDIMSYTISGQEFLSTYIYNEFFKIGIIVDNESKVAFRDKRKIEILMFISILIVGVTGLLISLTMAKKITNPLINVKNAIVQAGDGELEVKIDSKIVNRNDEFGELARSFERMVEVIKEIMESISTSSELLKESSRKLSENIIENNSSMENISNKAKELLRDAETDSAALDEGVRSIDEIAKSSENVSENTENLMKNVDLTVSAAEKGYKMMEETAELIENTHSSFGNINASMEKLKVATDNIDGIIDSIIYVSESTNLLALNAAIEAARAGEAGRGFAVVADEIRKLASQSNTSAEKITSIISDIQKIVISTFDVFSLNREDLEKVIAKTENTKERIEDIVSFSKASLGSVNETSALTMSAASATEEVLATMTEMSDSVKRTYEKTEVITKSIETQSNNNSALKIMSDELSDMAKSLEYALSSFSSKDSKEVSEIE